MMQSTLELEELDSKIAQLFMIGMPGPSLDEGTRKLLGDVGIGGVIFFARNIEDPIQLATLCRELQDLSIESQEVALFLAVDQEGGRVARLRDPFTEFPGNEAIARSDDPETYAARFAEITAKEMALVGLNMNLAPVLDIPRGEPEQHLKGRTFGSSADLVSRLGRIVISGLQRNGIMAVGKHFPGLGAARSDPHKTGLTIDLTSDEIKDIDLVPFKAAVESGVSGIMVSHAIYSSIDPENPGTLSRQIMHGLLRGELGYEGLILTDDLEMGAITKSLSVPEAAALAFEAGADLLLICERQGMVMEAISEIRSLILKGSIPLERLQRSTERIAEAKKRYLGGLSLRTVQEIQEYFGLA